MTMEVSQCAVPMGETTTEIFTDTAMDAAIFDLFNPEHLGKALEIFERDAPNAFSAPDTGYSGSSDESDVKPFTSPATSSYGAEHTGTNESNATATSTGNSKKRSADVLDDTEPSDQHREKRLQRNRESAALSRWRKKSTMDTLSVKNRELERANARLNYLLACSSAEVQALRAELVRYQGASPVGKLVVPPPPSIESAALVGLVYRTKYASLDRHSLSLEYYPDHQFTLNQPHIARTSSLNQPQPVHLLRSLFLASNFKLLARKSPSSSYLSFQESMRLSRCMERLRAGWHTRRACGRRRRRKI